MVVIVLNFVGKRFIYFKCKRSELINQCANTVIEFVGEIITEVVQVHVNSTIVAHTCTTNYFAYWKVIESLIFYHTNKRKSEMIRDTREHTNVIQLYKIIFL